MLGLGPSCISLLLIVLTTGGLYSPPVYINYFFASFSSNYLIDWFEWTPLSLVLSLRMSFANLWATLSSVVSFLSDFTDGSQSLLLPSSLTAS